MERFNDILKPIVGIILIVSFVMAFSSCETKKGETADGKDTVIKYKITRDTVIQDENQNKQEGSWKEKMKQESEELGVQLDSLKEKAKKGSAKAQKEINQKIEALNKERKEREHDSTNTNWKEKWEEYKERARNNIDSLKKKI